MTARRLLALTFALAAGVLASACDPNVMLCKAAIDVHTQECEGGNSESCDWLATHVSPPGSYQCI